MSDHPLDPIFSPRATALVGLPSTATSTSRSFLTALLEQGYEREHGLYPVNPKLEEVEGLRCYPTLLDTPDPVDHVISLVPARVVPSLVDQCIEKGVRSVHFYTAGFSETGDEEMANIEAQAIEQLTAAGIRAIGPNCMGFYVPRSGLAFMGRFPTEPGNVCLISQSGANAGEVVHGLSRRGARFSKVISFGNGADLTAADFFDYAATDDESEVVTAYIEGVRDGRRFFEAVKRCAAVKPTIILKGGLTGAGARAANSHTGSLAGSTAIFEALCRQAGAIRAENMDELHDLAIAVATSARNVRGTGVALVGGGGGFAVLSSDAVAAAGLDVPPMPEATKQRLHEFVPVAGTSVNNPIDTNLRDEEDRERLYRTVAESDPIDVVFTNPTFDPQASPFGQDDELSREEREQRSIDGAAAVAVQLGRMQDETGIPFVGVLRQRDQNRRAARRFEEEAYRRGVAVFPSVHRAARAIGLLREWRARREGLPKIL